MLRLMLAAIVALGAFLVLEARADASPYAQHREGPNKYWQLCPTSASTYVRLLLNPCDA